MSNNSFYTSNKIDQINDAWKFIKKSRNITLLTHSSPDGDGISACAALDATLIKLGKNTETIYPDKPEFIYKRQATNIFIGEHKQKPDLIIAVDTANYQRLYWPTEFKNIPLINIDHHISNSLNGKFNFVNPQSSSACEELYIVLQNWDASSMDKYIAECLLFGILYDGQIFHINSINPKKPKYHIF